MKLRIPYCRTVTTERIRSGVYGTEAPLESLHTRTLRPNGSQSLMLICSFDHANEYGRFVFSKRFSDTSKIACSKRFCLYQVIEPVSMEVSFGCTHIYHENG